MASSFFRILAPAVPLVLLAAGGGCTQDPLYQPGTWRPTGANEQNLRAMVATPSDLERGVGASTDRGDAGSLAATRLLIERRRPLLSERASEIGASESAPGDTPIVGLGGGGGAGGGAAGGGASAAP